MKRWTCRQVRRRIPLWTRGHSSTAESGAIATHVTRCAACAADVALEAALSQAHDRAAPATPTDRHEMLWQRLETAIATPSRPPRGPAPAAVRFAAKTRLPRLASSRRRVFAVTASLVATVSLGAGWWSSPRQSLPPAAPAVEMSLWQPEETLIENPMGPTTDRLLVILEKAR